MNEQKQEDAEGFNVCFYRPVSFVMFLIALTFDKNPSIEYIAAVNLWIKLLFEILPIVNLKMLKELEFDLKTRSEFVNFVFTMHEKVLHETLDKKQTLQFFEQLRANDCSKTGKEISCVKNTQKIPSVCVVMIGKTKPESGFWMDTELQTNVDSTDALDMLWERAMESTAAFCSCVFSAKWFVLHMIACGFAKNPSASERHKYHTFLGLFGRLLACFACRVNFQANMELVQYNSQTDLLSRTTFVNFMYRLHEAVNTMLGKEVNNVSLEETIDYFNMLATKTSDDFFSCVMIAKEKDAIARFYFSNK